MIVWSSSVVFIGVELRRKLRIERYHRVAGGQAKVESLAFRQLAHRLIKEYRRARRTHCRIVLYWFKYHLFLPMRNTIPKSRPLRTT